jgi:hypothetical protein
MAESLAHTLGQVIGNVLEDALEPPLREFAAAYGLYLDKKGPRKAREGKKVTWRDLYGNAHGLDFVLERGGTDEVIGTPVAFIETAWRRYTKHSRNKAQEIQGAIQVLALTHKYCCPFVANSGGTIPVYPESLLSCANFHSRSIPAGQIPGSRTKPQSPEGADPFPQRSSW